MVTTAARRCLSPSPWFLPSSQQWMMTMRIWQSARGDNLLLSRQSKRFLSSESEAVVAPLVILWKGTEEVPADALPWRPKLLVPFSISAEAKHVHVVSSTDEALERIHRHYSHNGKSEQFVGGMGESDPGVALAGSAADALDCVEPLSQLMQLVKQERHGVPFHVCTTGIAASEDDESSAGDVTDEAWDLWSRSGVSSWHVSLYAASPPAYIQATGENAAATTAFGQVCNFVLGAAERGMAVEASVLPAQATAAREMALALGARHVHVVEPRP